MRSLLRTVVLCVFAWPAAAAAPGWITSCAYSHSNNDDPIVHPGEPGAAHLHDFVGAKDTDAFSTPDSMQASGSSCAMPGDTSGYWVPALYRDGIRVLPNAPQNRAALFYYRRQGSSAPFRPIPRGLKIIVGNANATSPGQNEGLASGKIIFKCGPGSGTNLPNPPPSCTSGLMVISMTFPNCWDGKNLDSPDHKSHMKYPPCTASHPIPIPRVESFWRYPVPKTGPIGVVTLAAENNTRRPWWTTHGDFFMAWVPPAFGFLMTHCILAGTDCGINPATP